MKKIMTLLLAGCLAASLLVGCGDKHVHTAVGGWDRDAKEHWLVCEDGEKMDVGTHILNDDSVCTVCGSTLIDWGDGSFDVYNSDEHGETIRCTSYDSDGVITSDSLTEITYDEEGNKTHVKTYREGILSDEVYYAIGADGVYEVKYISYNEDGSYFTNEYNEDSELILACTYDENGVEVFRVISEYAEDEDGNRYVCLNTEYDYVNQKIYIGEYNAFEDQIGRKVCSLDGTVILENRYEYTYNGNGKTETYKEYENGRLVFEVLSFGVYSDEEYTMRYPKTTVDYYEDGSKTVTEYEADDSRITFEYDAAGNLVKETAYDAEGNII